MKDKENWIGRKKNIQKDKINNINWLMQKKTIRKQQGKMRNFVLTCQTDILILSKLNEKILLKRNNNKNQMSRYFCFNFLILFYSY